MTIKVGSKLHGHTVYRHLSATVALLLFVVMLPLVVVVVVGLNVVAVALEIVVVATLEVVVGGGLLEVSIAVVAHVAHVAVHVGPGVLIVGVPAAHVDSIASSSVHAGDEWNPELLQLRGADDYLVHHDPVKVAVHLGHTFHGTGTGHIGFLSRILVVILILSWLPGLLLNRSGLLLHWSGFLLDRPGLLRTRLLLGSWLLLLGPRLLLLLGTGLLLLLRLPYWCRWVHWRNGSFAGCSCSRLLRQREQQTTALSTTTAVRFWLLVSTVGAISATATAVIVVARQVVVVARQVVVVAVWTVVVATARLVVATPLTTVSTSTTSVVVVVVAWTNVVVTRFVVVIAGTVVIMIRPIFILARADIVVARTIVAVTGFVVVVVRLGISTTLSTVSASTSSSYSVLPVVAVALTLWSLVVLLSLVVFLSVVVLLSVVVWLSVVIVLPSVVVALLSPIVFVSTGLLVVVVSLILLSSVIVVVCLFVVVVLLPIVVGPLLPSSILLGLGVARNRACTLTDVGAPVEAAERVPDAVHVSLTYAPAIGGSAGALLGWRNIVHGRAGTLGLCVDESLGGGQYGVTLGSLEAVLVVLPLEVVVVGLLLVVIVMLLVVVAGLLLVVLVVPGVLLIALIANTVSISTESV